MSLNDSLRIILAALMDILNKTSINIFFIAGKKWKWDKTLLWKGKVFGKVGASLLGNLLAGKGARETSWGWGKIRAGEGTVRAGEGF